MRGLPDEELLLIGAGIDGDIEETHHHFIPCLITPLDWAVGVGIVRVAFGVVIPGYGLQHGASFERARLGEPIAELPVEVVVHAKKSFGSFVGVDNVVLEALSTKVHVREKAEEQAIVRNRATHLHAIVVCVGRDRDCVVVVGELESENALFRS